ncbi:Sensor histidine kinase YpdA [compost metagenome]
MLLQPLVENAIFHGIVPKNTDGRITITIRNSGEGLEIRVQDDGRGFEEDKLGLLNKAKNGAEEGEIGIGLRHIFDSLRLYYDNDWECSFESSPGQGTIVRIVLKQAKETTSWN